MLLHSADGWRTYFITRAHPWGLPGFLSVVLGIALIAAFAAWTVSRFAPEASGSGIPYVEHQRRVGGSGNPLAIVIVKFFGGFLAIGGGLVLGREAQPFRWACALGNVAKHAQAKHVQVKLSHVNDRVRLAVSDDGVGFTPDVAKAGGLGLVNMRERVRQLNGTPELQSEPAAARP